MRWVGETHWKDNTEAQSGSKPAVNVLAVNLNHWKTRRGVC